MKQWATFSRILIHTLFFIAVCAIAANSRAVADNDKRQNPYNEFYNRSGRLRPAYQRFFERTGLNPLAPPPQVTEKLTYGKPLGDKIQILSTFLILSYAQQEKLVSGSLQVGRALSLFFEDVIFGEGRILKENLIPPRLLDLIANEENWGLPQMKEIWRNKTANDLSFIFGPDYVRNPRGSWRALEYNVFNVGGIADQDEVNRVVSHTWDFSSVPKNEFVAMIRTFLDHYQINTDETVALFRNLDGIQKELDAPGALAPDNEEVRELRTLLEMNIRAMDADKLNEADQQFIAEHYKGVINLTGNPFSGPDRFKKAVWLYRDLFEKRGIHLLNAPGLEILGNKALLPYIAQIIRFYLNEQMIIPPPPTYLLEPGWVPQPGWVVKGANGHQGEEVWIIDKLPAAEQRELVRWAETLSAANLLVDRHKLFVRQEYVETSVIPTPWIPFSINLRPITLVLGRNDFYVPKSSWGRAIARAGDGRGNVNRGAFELAVYVESKDCRDLF
jgi:uncharacterized circularly permuted ATP-grasp superfamily protein